MSGPHLPNSELPPESRRRASIALTLTSALVIAGCGTLPPPATSVPPVPSTTATAPSTARYFSVNAEQQTQEMVVFALGLLGTGYRFGGTNPDAGVDCSGMVGYIVEQVSGLRLPRSAAQIAAATRPIEREALQPGDLVFFNTANRRHSHMGIYVGEGRFIHAPSSRGQVRVSRLDNPYFAPRFDGARSLLAAD